MEVQILVLKEEYKRAIKKNEFLKKQLASFNLVSEYTIDRWRNNNDPMLTTATSLDIIKKFLNLPEGEVLTEPEKEEVHESFGLGQ